MKKRIIICADGTWNHPEKDLSKDFPTNILKLARSISPTDTNNVPQQVFYDWGVGSYYDSFLGGVTGHGLHKNILDNYRYIVQNYSPGDELFLFGFSRGSYTIRCLCGLINNCGILKKSNASLIEEVFKHYKNDDEDYRPNSSKSKEFRETHSHSSRDIHFVGAWDTVGSMGIPLSFLGFFNDKDEFYDTKLGNNVLTARHAMAIDEHRSDFEPTIWETRENINIKQVWFAGAHSNIGGSYKADNDGSLLSDIALLWMLKEANDAGLSTEEHLHNNIKENPLATLHNSRRNFYRIKKTFHRNIDHKNGEILIHNSVKQRWDQDSEYRPPNLKKYIDSVGAWPNNLVD